MYIFYLILPVLFHIEIIEYEICVNKKLVHRFKKRIYLKFTLALIKKITSLDNKNIFFFKLKVKRYLILFTLTLFIEAIFLVLTNSYELCAILSSVLIIVFYFINYQKCRILKEPIVWSDICLLKEVFLCPKFYLAYVPKITYLYLVLVLFLFLLCLYYVPKHNVDNTIYWSALFVIAIVVAIFIIAYHKTT